MSLAEQDSITSTLPLFLPLECKIPLNQAFSGSFTPKQG
ncbi:hypothetical protein JCM19231_5786 [Vibrio ishigakensis]|uniref:Uncharacterized protein n=1 Tax=Vibrio ishigakensis TaxID=1481914 RepID=A0A0B8NLA7_9VIBR|nr:hypothetical protein JCM19231_5786 [Vibrio ishigakensis]